jgi:uncharacterized protein (DUF2267 family)
VSTTAALTQGSLLRRSVPVACARHVTETKRELALERTSQIIFGERQYLLRILDSVERTQMPAIQQRRERQALERLIQARTQELNRMNPHWDEKVAAVLRPGVSAEELDQLAREAPEEDCFLLRLISEHPQAASNTLDILARNPNHAIRENVARHPHAAPETLLDLCHDHAQPLWYLVAYNPSAPAGLRRRLTRQMKQVSRRRRTK